MELKINPLTVGSAKASGDSYSITLSRYLEEEPNVVQRLLFDLPKQLIAAQKLSDAQDNENGVENAGGTELAHGDLMEKLNTIVRESITDPEVAAMPDHFNFPFRTFQDHKATL